MLFSKLFRKDAASCLEKGEKLLAAGRFAEARLALEDALERLDANSPEGATTAAVIREKMVVAGNRLAEMNLQEAEHCLMSGEFAKAEEHLNLTLDLADDVTIRDKAVKSFALLEKQIPHVHHHEKKGGCGGCGGSTSQHSENIEIGDDGLNDMDRFELLVRPLPGDLPERYADLGEEFAVGYLAAHGGDQMTAEKVFERLLASGESDILLYELAILSHQGGDGRRCETLLRRAFALNDANPLCNLSLVQLLTENGRFTEAVPLLERMVERNILPDQAGMFLGEIYRVQGESDRAIAQFSQLLSTPLKREAAERLVGLLEATGRSQEAALVAKQYLKGCC
ncbi:tetratricopeptide repeat protein [Geobacter hydrogenophilus]|uniref:Tetratricopeptide repeat protein n=1 Tax=Geobacter hydrogenophilus TaxID=40983 RepID=A0A9W6G1X5_9BACT|nr:tetratricopeptide repeat protein [Geobacter hydrogenophilus]MBT0893137.1 tetratricopeptide repeat protein [Geobacter hydrogenophilus]GLI39021.1 hypothetical protein GHYDROH2_25220 [Geobacter hydrogenophilus]